MGAPTWVDERFLWTPVRHRDAPDNEVWAVRVKREGTVQLNYDEERAPFTLGAVAETNSMGHAVVKPTAAPSTQPERIPVRVYRGDYIVGFDGKAWVVPNIVYLYTYREAI